jgi:hypothetical protein
MEANLVRDCIIPELFHRRKEGILGVLDLDPLGTVGHSDHIEPGGSAAIIKPDEGIGGQNDIPLFYIIHHLRRIVYCIPEAGLYLDDNQFTPEQGHQVKLLFPPPPVCFPDGISPGAQVAGHQILGPPPRFTWFHRFVSFPWGVYSP